MDSWDRHDLLSGHELAALLGVCRATLYKWVKKGKLPPAVRPRQPRAGWPREAVQHLIDEAHGQRSFPFGAAA